MSRRKMKYNLPLTLVQIVKSICADYDRRKSIIERQLADENVTEEYMRLNGAIDDAFADVDEGLKRFMLDDIKQCRGYEASMTAPYIAKNTYYKRKKKIIFDVAKSLNLL